MPCFYLHLVMVLAEVASALRSHDLHRTVSSCWAKYSSTKLSCLSNSGNQAVPSTNQEDNRLKLKATKVGVQPLAHNCRSGRAAATATSLIPSPPTALPCSSGRFQKCSFTASGPWLAGNISPATSSRASGSTAVVSHFASQDLAVARREPMARVQEEQSKGTSLPPAWSGR